MSNLNWLSVTLVVAMFLLAPHRNMAQDESRVEANIDLGNRCESNVARLDRIHASAGDEPIIAIARLGNRENGLSLNRRRLHNFKLYLTTTHARPAKSVITAKGDRAPAGIGRIEVYVKGRLFDVFGLGRGEDFVVGSCDGTGRADHLFYGKRRRSRR